MIERLVASSTRHRTAVLAVTALAAFAAVLAARQVKLDALPDVTTNQVLVLTSAPGFSPDEVERRVTLPVELALAGAPGMIERRSTSRFGISSVTAVFEDGVPAQSARQLVMERLAALAETLPEGVGDPELGPLTGGLGEIFHVSLRSPVRSQRELRELAELRASPILRNVPGVVEVNAWGGERRALAVDVEPARLAAFGFTLRSLAEALSREVGTAHGGSIPESAHGQTLLRATVQPVVPSTLAGLHVASPSGAAVRLSELATVREIGLPRLGAATQDGRGEVVYLMAQMLRDANALEVTQHIQRVMPDVARALPADVQVDLVYDRSHLVWATLRTVGKNLAEGGTLVVLVLFAMLGSFRAGLIVAAVIPLSMLGASVGMAMLGVAGNLMSLGALDFGLLVDGAVVMIDHIFHEQHRSPPAADEPRHEFIARSAARIARPVAFSVLTILLVYIPVLSLSGVDGKMFRPMALVVVMALATALLLSLTFVPAAAAVLLRAKDVPVRHPLLARVIERLHVPLLGAATRRPTAVALVAVAILAFTAWGFTRAGSELAPQLDEGDLVLQTTRAADIRLDEAIVKSLAIERAVRSVPEVERIVSRIGSPTVATDIMGLEQADVFVRLLPKTAWREGKTRTGVIQDIEAAVRRIDPDVELAFTQPIQMRFNELLGGAVSDVSVSVFGDDLDELHRIASEARARIARIEGAHDVRVMAPENVPLLEIVPDFAAAAALDVRTRDVLDAVAALRTGLPVATTYDGPLPIPIVIRTSGTDSTAAVASALIANESGGLVPMSTVARIERRSVPSLVQRFDGQRRLMLGFNVRGVDLGTVTAEAKLEVERAVELPRGYRMEWGGQAATLADAAQRLAIVIPVVLVMIIALMFSVFRDARMVALLLMHIPFACAGGIGILFARGMPLSVSAAIGFIALSGVAVMNAMVLLTELRSYEQRGFSPADAAWRAARDRARPVIMTALVAALGFVPMVIATGVGAEVQRPLASVVVFGLMTATGTTLVIMPALYPRLRGKAARTRATTAASGAEADGAQRPAA